MIYLGVDPGTSNNMAVAAIMPDGKIKVRLVAEGEGKDARSRAIRCARRLHQAITDLYLPVGYTPTVAVEWQRPLSGDKNPKNICDLAAFTGIALAIVEESFIGNPVVYTPTPEEWKGSTPKHIKHNRIVAVAGLQAVCLALQGAGIPVPPKLGRFEKEFTGMAGNALDAIGLAQWVKTKSWIRGKIPASK